MALEKLWWAPVDFTVWTVIFATDTVIITVHTVKCTGAHRNFARLTNNYSISPVITQIPFFACTQDESKTRPNQENTASHSHFFPNLKQYLGEIKFSSNKEVQVAVNDYFESLEESFFKTGLETKRQKCIELGGDYVEKQRHFRKSLYLFSWSSCELFNPPLYIVQKLSKLKVQSHCK